MLIRSVVAGLICLTVVNAAMGQSRDTDSQTLREILAELRAIHEDMRVTETTQLLVAELEMQQGVVNRATENVDNARSKLNDIHADQKHIETVLENEQEAIDKMANADEKNSLSMEIERQKSNLAELKNVERDRNTTLQQMEQRLQGAQDKLAGIEDELSAAISQLRPLSKGAGQK